VAPVTLLPENRLHIAREVDLCAPRFLGGAGAASARFSAETTG
jgi:hypothetical protein